MLKTELYPVVSFCFWPWNGMNNVQLADIFGAITAHSETGRNRECPSARRWQGNEVLYDSAAVIRWYAERDAEIENEKLSRREVEELRQAGRSMQIPASGLLTMNAIATYACAGRRIAELKMPETPLKWWKTGHSVLSKARSRIAEIKQARRSPLSAAAFSGTGKPTCRFETDIIKAHEQSSRAG
ncbi:terminase small subunit [Escherichia coli]|nr:terminase small subunit [Escherichia coli]